MHGLSRILIVGASLGGWRTAQALRRRGFDGRLTLIGAEPYGPYDRPPLSKQVLLGEREPGSVAHADAAAIAALGVEHVRACRATGLDPTRRLVHTEDGSLPFDGLVIATGARPVRPDFGWPLGVHTLRTLDDAITLRAALSEGPRVAVIGAGFIGLEVASAARALGLSVTVIEGAEVPMLRAVGSVAGRAIAELAREHGVRLKLGTAVQAIEGSTRVERIRCTDGAAIDADLVVVGVGVRPCTDWLAGSGLAVDDGVVCDRFGAARAAPPIYAVGDVARWHRPELGGHVRVEHWTNAVDQADIAAQNLVAGGRTATLTTAPFFWSEMFDTKVQVVGRVSPGTEIEVVPGRNGAFLAVAIDRGLAVGAIGFDQPRLMAGFRRMLVSPTALTEARALAWSELGAQPVSL
jgi:3-phenylpropionate/trans-cinnamate dioxygenase ferredoxin reductase component